MSDVEQLNKIEVTFKELWQVAQEAELLNDTGAKDFRRLVSTIQGIHRDQPMKGAAVLLRMQALAYLLENEGASGWSLPEQADGSSPTQKQVFEAAAAQPLVQEGEHARFERDAFLGKVSELGSGGR